ncbi:MAG: hypothetical protein AVDCRST_MAG68-3253 [uncultured Gemmatimonadetes bacterium]|uniref:Uncharacterized protein n=1 Tax=uncultured Gemmatimonadota bacterium TaxID=203437 RepID=A0A6J4LX68_9BACT|nr:MAG: hypothetical protein AVDCRST_MAG68-3253 [uncultured Gemmatimonadota bacterium]
MKCTDPANLLSTARAYTAKCPTQMHLRWRFTSAHTETQRHREKASSLCLCVSV